MWVMNLLAFTATTKPAGVSSRHRAKVSAVGSR